MSWRMYEEDTKLRRQYSKILAFTFPEKYGFGWFAFLVILFCFFPSVKKCNIVIVRKKDKKKYSEGPVLHGSAFSWLVVHLNHMAVFAQINRGEIFQKVPEKRNVSMRIICPCLCWSKKTQTQIHMLFLLCYPRIFGSLPPSPGFQLPPPKSESLLCLWNASCSSRGRRHSSASCLIAKKTALVCSGLTTRAENENRLEKQQDACNSLFGVSQNKIHLSSPDESHCFQMIWRGNHSLLWNWKAGKFSRTMFSWTGWRTLWEKRFRGLDFYRIFASYRFFQMFVRSIQSESPGMGLWHLHFNKIYRWLRWRAKFENDCYVNTPKGNSSRKTATVKAYATFAVMIFKFSLKIIFFKDCLLC